METSETQTVKTWHRALNDGSVESLLDLSSDDVEVGGPRGVSHGKDALRAWLARAGVTLMPKKLFQRGETVVVEQHAEWRVPGTDRIADQQSVASLFVVRRGLVVKIIRYPDPAAALR